LFVTLFVVTLKPSTLRLLGGCLAAIAFLAWCASLALPAITMGPFSVYGWDFLIRGWQGLTALNIGGISWLANPLLLAAWLNIYFLAERRHVGLICAWAAAAASLTSFLFNLLGQADTGLIIEDYDIGFYLWLAGAFLQALSSTVLYLQRTRAAE
jgi:hypothetical protein